MSEAPMLRKVVPQSHSSASGQTQMTSRQPYISEPIASKHVCFYKSGDAQFSGLPVVVNSRTFKTFEALLDSLSKRVPLPFGVRNITTPRGHTAVRSLEQLHHGHSYICSDRRMVKPVDLERARRKLPPWYHARPVSAHRTAWQTHAPAPRGTRGAKGNKHAALLHMPKRLVVYRNGEPEVKHTLMLQKRTTSSFEALLQHMSEVMTFPVLRLYTPDGRRVDGLPALILCSGVLVATGREAFKTGNYDIQKTSPPTWLPAKRVGRLHLIERKMKSSSTKSRPFSPSSERYVVEQIHNSIAGGTCDFPSNPAGSLEIESGQPLESVAETDMITCLDGEGNIHVPPEDDIEKSFRVNQDGSMTVEMKVRLTIKEEETVHWTTTVSRSSVTNQITAFSDSSLDLDARMPPLDDPMIAEVSDPKDNSHLKNCEANEQSEINGDAVVKEIKHPSSPQTQSPGLHKVQQTQASAESIRTVTDREIQENSSYSYKEQLDSGEMMEKHCTVHCSRPVPKPRGTLASEMNTTTTSRVHSSSYRASEVLQLQENGKEVCETVLHIYEKQMCKENFSGNVQLGLQGFGTSPDGSLNSLPHGHLDSSNTVSPATSDTTFRSSSADMEPGTLATYKIKTTGKQLPSTHKTNASSYKANTAPTQKVKEPVARFTPASASQKTTIAKRISTSSTTSKRKPVRVIVKKNYLLKTANPERKQKDIKADILKEIRKIRADLLSQTGAMKLKEHFRANAVQKLLKQRNSPECIPLKSQREQLESNDSLKAEDASTSHFQESSTQALSKKNLLHASQPGTLTRQTSMHEEGGCQGQSQEISQCMSLPAVHSSSSLKNEYVELWLQKSQPPHLDEEPLPTTKTQKSTFHNEQKSSTEDPKIVDDEKDGDRGPQDSISNLDSVMKTTVSTNHSTKTATSSSSLNGHSPRNTSLPASQKMTPLPRKLSLKESSNTFNVSIENNLSINPKDTPSPSLQSTPLPSQPSLETIPKNNTKVKASLFHNQSVEKTQLSTKEHFEKKGTIVEQSQTKKRAQEKAQVNSDNTTKTKKNQLNSEINSKNFSCDTESCTSHEVSSEQRDLQAEKFFTVKMEVSPDMKPVLDNLCHSLWSLREITQWPSSSKKSKRVPDFSSHLASTFGSSSRILLAFLSIMTVKDGLHHLNARCRDESHLSCSEAMLMLQSLKELASIEDPDELRERITDLHTSASIELLQRWRDFQELSNKTKSHITTNTNESHQSTEEEEQAIQKLMEDLGVPERLAAICNMEKVSDSPSEVKENGFSEHRPEKISSSLSNCVLEDYVNLNVNSISDRAVTTHLPESSTSQISMTESLSRPDTETLDKHEKDLRGENFSEVKIIEKYNSIPDTDFFKDMPSIESSFGIELQKKQVQEIIVRHKRQKDKKTKKHQKNEKEMRVERQRGTDEGRGTLEENISEVENYTSVEDVIREVMTDKETDQHTDANEDSESLVSYEGKPTFYKGEVFNEREYENCDQELVCFPEGTYFDEEENLTVKCPMFYDDTEQTCSEDEISGHCQSQSKSQTSQKVPTRTDIGLPEQQGTSHVIDIEPNVEVGEIQHSNTAQDFCINNCIYSDEEHVIMETPECYTIYQELPEEVSEYEEKYVDFIDEKTNVVDKLTGSLKAEENRPCNTHQMSGKMLLNHINVTNVETPKMTKTTDSTSMDSLSTSLAFSYDTKTSELARDPEANIQINRVKSIREMFLAKSNTDVQHGQTRLTSPSSDPTDYQPDSPDSTEHQCSTSPKDEDTCRLAIAKGYVKRTIERLYGKGVKGVASDEDKPPSTHKTKKRKGPKGTNVTSLASIHEARTNVISDLSYFNATSFIEGFTDPNVTLKTWVGHKDAVLIDNGRWLLRENQTSPNSSTQAEDASKSVQVKEKAVVESEQNSGKEDAPYSLFGPTTPDKVPPFKEQEEYAGSTGTTFTYIHLPNASDSEIETDNTEHAKKDTENTVTPLTKPDKGWTEKHGILTVFSLPDIKKPNKVQPTLEATPPVVTQPSKGQSVQTEVAKRSSEPDALEILYMFCGQHCPLL